ncbi:ATPase family AAA domain-containing protein 2 isoform X4 [Aplysia californica]|uniref:ATPase family AAA domain-containing protein 2 isoform X4 n=1 Tax=Aplysia californica TaxID=6500 RepID=A0ABM0K524_APLCA|nr:ATPase family AAA domain-containing protein 2 isoform X4 [Aplysia californica]
MVRTRHSGDGEEECSPKFLSLRNERNRHGIKSTEGKEDGQHPTLSYRGGRHAYNVFEDKVVESRLRPRVGPSHAYNYLDADSSDDDSYRHSRRQPMHEMMSSRRRSRYSRSHDIKQELLEEHQVRSERRQRRRMSAPAEESQDHSVTDDDDEHTESMRRKSSRTKRQIYNKLNQSYLVSPPAQEKDVDEHMDQSDLKDQDSEDNQQFSDMYSRVKRKRVQVKRNMYGVPINDDSDSEQGDDKERNRNDNSKDDEEEEGDDDDEREEGEENGDNSVGSRRSSKRLSGGKREREQPVVKQYSLREHKPRTDLYKAPVEERKIRRTDHSIFASTPTKKSTNQTYQSPAQRRNKRKRSAFHSDSSSTSSSDSESSDEKKFKHRKNKSMAKARSRLMPMNFSSNALPPAGVIKDRVKSGASLADVEPMNIDRNVTFNSIGGLGKHIRALKEMVVFPLLYDKVFQRFKVDPPRGVLFYGPPGTGKTLVARALANECSHGDRKVAFFMRKGADCLSKWVGESERQLRLLFDQAYKFRPSIIFFDEIDGLAPVRSSRQDQIHSSIVSTLLALMDGLDSRGEIVVIGATNRIDSLDPALRRPGRFDREFLFPLPSLEARTQILKIHTACWTPKLNDHFISQLAEKCVGYCGADLKALCTEAAMLALRRRYPQIYISNEALQLDESSIKVSAKDFFDAVQNIIPTSQRAVNTPARALSARVCPLLQRQLDRVMSQLADTFPPCLAQISSLDAAATSSQAQALAENGAIWDELASDEEEGAPSIFVTTPTSKGSKAAKKHSDEGTSNSETVPTYLNFISYATSRPATFRPRMLLVGCEGQGQTTYIAPAVVHKMESLPVHVLDLPALYAVTAKTPEESCANVFHEAKRKCPSIVYLPYINQWWEVMAETLRATLLTLIHNLDPTLPLLLLATSEQPYHTLDPMLQSMFNKYSGEVVTMSNPNSEERKVFFQDLVMRQASRPPPQKKQAAQRMLEVLPKAVANKPRELNKEELKQLMEKEELTLMELRIFLRDVLNKLGGDKKFSIFAKPVDIDDAPDYYEVIEQPMDLSTMMSKIDLHEYGTVSAFMKDIDLVCSNALEYNPNRGPMDRVIRHRACALKDTAYAIIRTELDKDFEKMCMEIEESRKRRGQKSLDVPNFYYTKPVNQQGSSRAQQSGSLPSYLENPKPVRTIHKPEGERYSRRVRGLNIDPTPALESVEKVYRAARSGSSPTRDNKNNSSGGTELEGNTPGQSLETEVDKAVGESNVSKDVKPNPAPKKSHISSGSSKSQPSSANPKRSRTTKCVWCKPKRKRPRLMFSRHPLRRKSMEEETEVDLSQGEEDSRVTEAATPTGRPSATTVTPCSTTTTTTVTPCSTTTTTTVTPCSTTTTTAVEQQLSIEVSEHSSESKELKSPQRVSSRLRSPVLGNPVGVTTRRSSMSPRGAGSVVGSPTTSGAVEASLVEEEEEEVVDTLATPVQEETNSSAQALLSSSQNKVASQEREPLVLPSTSVSPVCGEKRSVVKRLDLEAVTVDSGVGSSVDSNGDSRDSLEHSSKEAPCKTPETQEINDTNQNCNAELKLRANAILQESPQKLVVDTQRLQALLQRLVTRTEGFTVEGLEKLYSHLSQVIYRHRHEYNRTTMILNLEKKAEELTRPVPSTSSSLGHSSASAYC